jgi:L-ribulose-5-phosphate 3-epimerase
MNPVIYFTKFLKGLNAEQVAQTARGFGFDGLDLAIRKGQAVNPDNVVTELPKAMATFKQHGLTVPLATLEGGALDPTSADLERTFAACGAAGVGLIKLGYWVWRGEDYWAKVEEIQGALGKFEKLGRKHNVCALVHTHCDEYYGSNASGAMNLVRNFDPKHVGVFLDPAHLSVDGEQLPMGIAIVKSHLRAVAAKAARYVAVPQPAGAAAKFKLDWCALNEGLVDWAAAVKLIKATGFTGPFSIHGEYSATEELEHLKPLVSKDLAFFRKCLNS